MDVHLLRGSLVEELKRELQNLKQDMEETQAESSERESKNEKKIMLLERQLLHLQHRGDSLLSNSTVSHQVEDPVSLRHANATSKHVSLIKYQVTGSLDDQPGPLDFGKLVK